MRQHPMSAARKACELRRAAAALKGPARAAAIRAAQRLETTPRPAGKEARQ